MSVDCPLLKPTCKRSLILGKAPYKKPVCPLTDLVPKCPLKPPSCPSNPPKCPLTPDPCPLSPPKCPLQLPPPCPLTCPPCPSPCPPPPCPLTCLPPPCPLKCPPPPCPLRCAPPPCPLTCPPPPCPLTCPPPPCPLTCPPPCPLTCPPCPPPCPLTCPPCPLPCPLTCTPCPSPCPLKRPPCPLPCPLTCPPPCPLTCPPPCPLSCPPPCPLTCPPPCPLSCPPPCPLKCSPCPPPCPLKCTISCSSPCPLSPPKCPLSPPKCPLIPEPCPLTVPPKPQCPLLPPKCPLNPPICPLQPPPAPPLDTCPLDRVYEPKEPCIHTQFLNKSLSRKPLSFPVPPVCHEIARKCPFEPRPMVCHELCPCSEVPEVDAGPPCPFLPLEPICPPLCPLERIPECPLIQKSSCMWKPQMPPQCPLSASSNNNQNPSRGCTLNSFDVCPSTLCVPGKAKTNMPQKQSLNIECCPFCNEQPGLKCKQPKAKKSFHFPTCPMYKPSCQLEKLPTNTPVCPFYPCPCPLAGCGDCPIKVPPLAARNNSQAVEKSFDILPSQTNTASLHSRSSTECPMNSLNCNVPASNCPLSSFKCPPPCAPPPPPCPVKGCLKKSSCKKPGDCPVKTEGCTLFPEGRCPMDDLRLCECDFPVPPCMVDQTKVDKPAPPQFCVKDNCCMGLPDPPTIPTPKTDDTYYSFMALHPEKEATKYYIDISNEPPPDLESLKGTPTKKALRPQCSIIKSGEGFKQCATVKKILANRGSCEDCGSQYDIKDCPMDDMTKRIRMSLKKRNK